MDAFHLLSVECVILEDMAVNPLRLKVAFAVDSKSSGLIVCGMPLTCTLYLGESGNGEVSGEGCEEMVSVIFWGNLRMICIFV